MGDGINQGRRKHCHSGKLVDNDSFFMMAYIFSLKLETRLLAESEGEEGKIRGSRNTKKC